LIEIYAATTPLDRVNVIEMGSGQFADAAALKTYMQGIEDGSTNFWDLTGYGREVWLLLKHNDWNFIKSTQKFIP